MRLVGCLLIALGLVAAIFGFTERAANNRGFHSDGAFYAAMALESPDARDLARQAPWCWRVLTPWLVSAWPGPTPETTGALQDRFAMLAQGSAVLTLVLLGVLLLRRGRSLAATMAGLLLYAGVFWTIKFAAFAPCYVDVEAQATIVAILLCLQTRVLMPTPLLLLVGALQREAVLFLLPAVLVQLWPALRAAQPRAVVIGGLAVVLPVVALAALRLLIPPANDYAPLAAVQLVLRTQLLDFAFWPRLVAAVFSGLGLLAVIVLTGRRGVAARLRQEPAWLAALVCGALLLFGGVDKARLMLPLVPVFVVFACDVIDDLLARYGRATFAWLILAIGLHAWLGNQFEPIGALDDYLNRLVPAHAPGSILPALTRDAVATAALLAATWFLRRRCGEAPAGAPPAPEAAHG